MLLLLLYVHVQALAQDQLRVLTTIICGSGYSKAKGNKSDELLPVRAMTCDGDTGHYDRMDVKEHANIILTNPDTLHCTFLPHVSHSCIYMQSHIISYHVQQLHIYA